MVSWKLFLYTQLWSSRFFSWWRRVRNGVGWFYQGQGCVVSNRKCWYWIYITIHMEGWICNIVLG
jgi:hypothetical protein